MYGYKIIEKWVIVSEWYWCRITKQKKEYEVTSSIDVLSFPKKFVREKWNFCNVYAIADGVLIVTFSIMTFMILWCNDDAEIFIWPLKCQDKTE